MASSSHGCRCIVLTGSPGVGKTTLIHKICQVLKTKKLPVKGFYTEECRENGTRVGFDAVSLDGLRAPLARVADNEVRSNCRVGKYSVQVQSFEQIALPELTVDAAATSSIQPVYVVDEIGKMEMFSPNFRKVIARLLNDGGITLLATIPVKGANTIPLVEEVRNHPDTQLFEVTRVNRDRILDEIVGAVDLSHQLTKT